MQVHERRYVLEILNNIFQNEKESETMYIQTRKTYIEYDFFEDLFDIIDGFHYDKHRLGIRVLALLEQGSEKLL